MRLAVAALEILLLLGFLGLAAYGVFWTTRSRRSESELKPVAAAPVETPGVTRGVGAPRTPSLSDAEHSRRPFVMLAAFTAGILAILGLQIIGVVRPDLLRETYGQVFATGVWMGVVLWLVLFSLMGVTSLVSASGGVRSRGATLANISLPTGWAVAAVGSLAVFAGLAVGFAVWDPPSLNYMAVDSSGRVLGSYGTSLVRWDASGNRDLDVDLAAPPFEVESIGHLAAGENREILIVDEPTRRVLRLGPDGSLISTLAADAPGQTPVRNATHISVAGASGAVWILTCGRVTRTDARGVAQVVYEDATARWASDIAVDDDGRVFIADMPNGRILEVGQAGTTAIDCLALGGAYLYPEEVEIASDGTVYSILRKPWQDLTKPAIAGARLSQSSEPRTWMGEVYRFETPSSSPKHIATVVDGRPVGVFNLDTLPDGEPVVFPLGVEGVFRLDPSTGFASPLAEGDLGSTLAASDVRVRVKTVAPQTFGGFALLFPILFGVLGATVALRRGRDEAASAGLRQSSIERPTVPGATAGNEDEVSASDEPPAARAARPPVTVASAGHVRKRSVWIVASSMVPMILIGVANLVFFLPRIGGSRSAVTLVSFTLLMMLLPAVAIAVLVIATRRPVSYTFTDEAMLDTRGKELVAWESVRRVSLGSATTGSGGPALLVSVGETPFGSKSLPFLVSDLGFGALRTMLAEMLARVSPELIDPMVLVQRDFLNTVSVSGGVGLDSVTERAVEQLHYPILIKKLRSRHDANPLPENALPLAQVLVMMNRPQEAFALVGTGVQGTTDSRVLLVAGLSAVMCGDQQLGLELLSQVSEPDSRAVLEAFLASVSRPAAAPDPSVRRANVAGAIVVGMLVLLVALQVLLAIARAVG